MYWILDVIVILLTLIAIICGYKRGIVDMLATLISVILLFALAIVGGAGFLLLFYKLNVVDNFAYAWISILGETNSLFSLLNMSSFDVCQIISALCFLIIGLIISAVIFVYLGKLLRSLYDKIPHVGVFGVISGVLGAIVYLAIVFGVLLAVFGVIHALNDKGNEFFMRLDEFLRSCTLSGWLYDINPFNGLFADLFA